MESRWDRGRERDPRDDYGRDRPYDDRDRDRDRDRGRYAGDHDPPPRSRDDDDRAPPPRDEPPGRQRRPKRNTPTPESPGGRELAKAGMRVLVEHEDDRWTRPKWFEVEDERGERWAAYRGSTDSWLVFGRERGDYGHAASAEEVGVKQSHGLDRLSHTERRRARRAIMDAPPDIQRAHHGLCMAVIDELAAARAERGGKPKRRPSKRGPYRKRGS